MSEPRSKRFGPLSRRTVLKGLGVSLALPALEAMLTPRGLLFQSARAAPSPAPKRFMVFHFPNGTNLQGWTPNTTGAGWELTPALQPLADHRAELNVLTGLTNAPYRVNTVGADDHQRAGATFAVGLPASTAGAGGPSIDQLVAPTLRGPSGPPLTVALFQENSVYHSNISWSARNTAVPPIKDPLELFNKLFATGGQPDATAELHRRRRSVLDAVKGDLTRLQARVGAADRVKLEQHAEAVREVELLLGAPAASCTAPAAPQAGLNNDQKADVMLRLIGLALQCDLTRTVSFTLGSTNNTRTFPWLGINVAHHEISHWRGTATRDEAARNILETTRWAVGKLAAFLAQLKAVDEGGRSLLYNSLVYFGSEFSDGDWHSGVQLPVLLAGNAGGAITTGRHLRFPCAPAGHNLGPNGTGAPYCSSTSSTPIANLYLSMFNALGHSAASIGDSTGPLPGLVG